MDIFGTVAAAVSLAAKIKATFEQAGYNKSDSMSLCSEIVKSLSQIEEYLKQPATNLSDNLRDDLSNFENELRAILRRLDPLINRSRDGPWERSTAKLKEVYNAGDVKHLLAQLHYKVQICEQALQRSLAVNTNVGVSTMNQQMVAMREEQESMRYQLQMLVDTLIPSSNPKRLKTLEQIEENIQDHISEVDTDGVLGQELNRIRTMNGSQDDVSVKTANFSLKSYSSSVIERDYLKRRIKELATTLWGLSDQAVRQSGFLWFHDPFKGLVVWDGHVQNRSQQDSIRETLRILEVLRSKQKILYVDAARDLLSLGRALGHLGMREEASVMYDWGVQVCREIVDASNPRMLFNLAQFLQRMFMDLVVRGQVDDGRRVLEHAVKVQVQLGQVDQDAYISEQASFLHSLGDSAFLEGRYEDALKLYQEAVAMCRGLVERNRDMYLPDLALSLHHLGISMKREGRYEDAVKLLQEVITMYRELAEKNRDYYLFRLSLSLHNLGAFLYIAGQYGDAVKVDQEAVTMRRELVEGSRGICLPKLANSLNNLGASVHSAGRFEDSVQIQQETVTICRELVEGNQDTHLPNLARSLHNLGTFVHSAGRYEEAVTLLQETVTMRRELVERNRDTYLHLLAFSLHRLGVFVHSTGRYEDAVKLLQEVVKMYRELAEGDRKAHLPDLALSIRSLVMSLGSAQRDEEAAFLEEEACGIDGELAKYD